MNANLDPKKSERGVVLLIVLITVAILTTLVVDFIYSTQVDTTIAANARDEMKARYVAKSGVYVATEVMSKVPFKVLPQIIGEFGCAVESPQENWTVRCPSIPVGGGVVSVVIKDERSKINLNGLVDQRSNKVQNLVKIQLIQLFGSLGIDDDKYLLFIGSLTNWLDRPISRTRGPSTPDDQDSTGANAGFYERLEIPYRIKNGPLDSLREILLIEGMDKDFFESIKNYVTVYLPGQRDINFSTASRLVMTAALKGMAASASSQQQGRTPVDDDVIECIVDGIIEARGENPVIKQQKANSVKQQCLQNQQNSFNIVGVLITGESDAFSVTSTGVLGGENPTKSVIEAVIRKSGSGGSQGVNVLSWKEN